MTKKHSIFMWFFIGSLLAVYGVLIPRTGVYAIFAPFRDEVVLARLHIDFWWGAGMLLFSVHSRQRSRACDRIGLA